MILHEDPLELLRPPVGRVLGGVFCTHALDERFVEWLLATLLPIHADPEADERTFLDEGRRRLRETPIVVLADARQYVGGHRLPFDVHLTGWNTRLHARLSMVLFGDHARLLVGSGNLSNAGFGGNAELFAWQKLSYQKDAAVFADVLTFLEQAGVKGEGWQRFSAQLEVLTDGPGPAKATAKKVTPPAAFFGGEAILAQFFARIPTGARIEKVAVAAVASPEDEPGDLSGTFRRLGAFLAERQAEGVKLDVVLPWPDNPVPGESPPQPVAAVCGRACAWLPPGEERATWGLLEKVGDKHLTMQVAGKRRRIPRRNAEAGMAADPPSFWTSEEVVGIGPVAALEQLVSQWPVTWWLLPENRWHRGRSWRRPLHGSWVLVHTRFGKRKLTHLLISSGEPRLPKGRGTRVLTAGTHWRLGQKLTLHQLLPGLVAAPAEGFYIEEPWLPPGRSTTAPPLESCVYDAKTTTLRLGWRTRVGDLRVSYTSPYGTETLLDGPPGIETVVRDLRLDPNSAEVTVQQGEEVWHRPMAITHVAHLMADEPVPLLSFGAWIRQHGGRATTSLGGDEDPPAGPSPGEVFMVLDSVRRQLERAGPSLGAFEVLLVGPVGCRVLADLLLAYREDKRLGKAEAWLYGHELLRMLRHLKLGSSRAGEVKGRRLAVLMDELVRRFAGLAPKDPGLEPVQEFYRAAP